jgi:SHS2 domain-containing protein
MTPVAPSHELVPHTAEVGIRARASSLGELLAEAGRAFAQLELHGAAQKPDAAWRRLEVGANDRASLLAEWLNELIYQAETSRWVPTEFLVEEVGERRAVLQARGVTLERAPGLVKAATYHGIAVREIPGGFEGEVVLDV